MKGKSDVAVRFFCVQKLKYHMLNYYYRNVYFSIFLSCNKEILVYTEFVSIHPKFGRAIMLHI